MPKKRTAKSKPMPAQALPPQALFARIGDILKLEEAGKLADAVSAARTLAVQNPDRAETARLAVDIAYRAEKQQAADTVVKALRAKHADSLAAGYAAAYVHLCRGRLDAARKAVDALTSRFPTSTIAAILFADVCVAQSDFDSAVAKLEAVSARHAEDGQLHHRLAGLYWRSARLDEAAQSAQRARDLGVTLTINTRLLGAALCQLERYEEALPFLQEVNATETDHFETVALLSVARCGAGDNAGAMFEVERALDLKPFSVRNPNGASQNGGLTALVLEFGSPAFFMRGDFGAYQEHNYISYLTAPDLTVVHTPVTRRTASRLAQSGLRPDLIVNNMVVRELVHDDAADYYREVIADFDGVPVINPAEAVAQCGRLENSRKFDNETGFIFPRTRRFTPDTMTFDELLAAIEEEFSWPILIRPTHTNLARGMRLIDGPDALRGEDDLMTLKDCFVIQYHECHNDDGVARQHRALIIGEESFAERVNAYKTFVSGDYLRGQPVWWEEGFAEDEQAFLADPNGFLGFDWREVFAPMIEQTPLDIFGFDFSKTSDGRPVVFEVNASMNLFNMNNAKRTPYLMDYYEVLNDTVVRYLRTRTSNAA